MLIEHVSKCTNLKLLNSAVLGELFILKNKRINMSGCRLLVYLKSKSAITVTVILYCCWSPALAQVSYPAITAQKKGPGNPFSPDPIFGYEWKNPKATDELEVYYLDPVSFEASPRTSFDMSRFSKEKEVLVQGTGSIRFDFSRTNAGWLEFESDDLVDSITMSISEYNEPAIVNTGSFERIKTKSPVKRAISIVSN
jgi:hypothetical protein